VAPVPEDDLRELGGSNLTDPDFPRRNAPPPDPDVRHVRSRYRLFRRDPDTDLWACACGRESCRRDARTWEALSGAYQLWVVPSELGLLDRVVRVLRATGAHFGTAPGVGAAAPAAPAAPAVVANYSDLSRAQRDVLLAGKPHGLRRVVPRTAEPLVRRGFLVAQSNPDLRPPDDWYRLTDAGLRARRALESEERYRNEVAGPPPSTPPAGSVTDYSDLGPEERAALLGPPGPTLPTQAILDALVERGLLKEDRFNPGVYLLTGAGMRARRLLATEEVPDSPGTSEPRAPRTWRLGDPDPDEDGLEVVDCEGDVWRRHGGRWNLVEWASRHPVHSHDSGTTWSEVREYAPLTERLHRDPKRARPADCLQVPMATLLETVQRFLGGTGSLSDLRRARLVASRALGDSWRASR
jgi:hypothetical protein